MAHVRVEVTRSGGFAGIVRHAAVDSAELEPQAAEALARLVEAVDLDAPHAGQPSGADRFQYDIAVTGADGRKRAATVREGALTPQLKALVQHVLDR
jgi:hypothetical protein